MKNDQNRLLLVEDQDAFAELLGEILAAHAPGQFKLVRVPLLQTALHRLAGERFDVVLLDLMLPDREGLETFAAVRATAPSVPIVVLTGMDDEEFALEAVRQGAQDYLVKGQFDGRMLARILRYAMERKRVTEALRRSEEFFRLISENVTDLIVVVDRHGRRLYNSASYRPLFGDPAAVMGTDSFEEIHPEDRERIRGVFRQTLETGVGQRAEFRLLLKTNEVRHIESHGSVIRDATGQADKVVVVSRDVTERKETVESLRQALAALRQSHEELQAAQPRQVQAEKLAAVSTFAAGVAHEVKNPLQAIALGVDFLADHVAGDDPHLKTVLHEMDQAVHRADGIIRGLLEFTAYHRHTFTETDLGVTLEQALQSVQSELSGAAITTAVDLAMNLPRPRLDAKTWQHVFINLFLNAVRALPHGGQVRARTFARTNEGGAFVAAEIDYAPRRGEAAPFRAASPAVRNALGLTVIQKIVELHGGRVEIVERDDDGAGVTILFPTEPIAKQP